MYKLGALEKGVFPNLKYSVFAGEPLSINLANAWSDSAPNSTVENRYGPTETTVDVTRYSYKKTSLSNKFHNDIIFWGP